jgi:hypothetical protein
MSKLRYDIRSGVSIAKTRITMGIAALAVALGGGASLALVGAAHADSTTTVVTPTNLHGWSTSAIDGADNRGAGAVTFTSGFGAPAGYGTSSLKLSTTAGSDKAQMVHAAPSGMLLSDLTNIGYSTYRQSPVTDANQIAAINLVIDYNGAATGGFATLVFEPVYQPGGVAAINNDTWQSWDASGGAIWWSTKVINGTCAFTCYTSLSDIQADNPDAVVQRYIVNQGSGNPSLVSGVDAFTFNDTVYDFELYAVANSKDQCKQSSWQGLADSNGNSFKNQGDCVSFVATQGKNKANG